MGSAKVGFVFRMLVMMIEMRKMERKMMEKYYGTRLRMIEMRK